MASAVHRLELDLDVFAGPFDLLLSLILREDVDLLEVELADIVVSYLDHLEASEQLDLEAATEFLVLIAALLELKSRLMLPGEELPELDELAPAEAAEELLERMLQYARFRGAGGTWPSATTTSRATSTAPRRCPRRCAARRWPRPSRPTTRPCSAPRWVGCCARRRRSTSATSRRRASRWPTGWPCCAGCCAAARSRSTTPCAAPTG